MAGALGENYVVQIGDGTVSPSDYTEVACQGDLTFNTGKTLEISRTKNCKHPFFREAGYTAQFTIELETPMDSTHSQILTSADNETLVDARITTTDSGLPVWTGQAYAAYDPMTAPTEGPVTLQVTLGGRGYRLRPTFGAIREIEARCNSSCATLLELLARRELHAAEMAHIVYIGGAEAGEKFTDPEAVGKRLFEAGVSSDAVRGPIAAYLAELLFAPDTARKKAVGEWWAASEEITSRMFSVPPISSDGDPETFGEPLPENSGPASKRNVKNPKR